MANREIFYNVSVSLAKCKCGKLIEERGGSSWDVNGEWSWHGNLNEYDKEDFDLLLNALTLNKIGYDYPNLKAIQSKSVVNCEN
jgi:hypothetical protein